MYICQIFFSKVIFIFLNCSTFKKYELMLTLLFAFTSNSGFCNIYCFNVSTRNFPNIVLYNLVV